MTQACLSVITCCLALLAMIQDPHQFLLFTQEHELPIEDAPTVTDVRIISLDTPSVFIDTLTPVTIPGSSAKFIAYDITQHKVYWSQLDPPQIRRSSLDGTGEETIVDTSISVPESLAVDPYSMNLYWVDSKLDKIEVYGLEKGYRRVLVWTGSKPQGLALDLRNRYMYWTDLDAERPRVERCHLDGSHCEHILHDLDPKHIRQPATIAVDPLSDWVYWAEIANDRVFTFNGVTGEYVEYIFSGGHPGDIVGLAVHGDYLYWTDRSGEGPSLGRVDKVNLGGLEDVLAMGVSGVHSVLAANQTAETINFPACSMCAGLCLPSNTTTPTCTCADHLELSDDGSCRDPAALMVVGTSSGVYPYSRSAGSTVWDPFPDTPGFNSISPSRMDADFNTSTLYWIDSSDKLIYRSPLDVFQPERVVKCCVDATADLSVDWFGRNLYWTDSSRRVIEVAKLDGQHRMVLYRVPEELGQPNLITVDPLGGYLYWSPVSGAKIYRWRMAGGSPMNPSTVFWDSPSHSEVFGMSLNYTTKVGVSHQLYFGANTNMASEIFSKDVDRSDSAASSFDTVTSTGSVLVAFKGDFYFVIDNDIREVRHLYPGSDNVALSSFNIALRQEHDPSLEIPDFTIIHHTSQPGLHECSVNNNECGGGAVCLVESGVSGVCVCPPLEASRIETDSQGVQHYNCAPTDAFVLIATEDSIYHLPFVEPSLTESYSEVQLLPLGLVDSIGTLAFDPVTKRMLYTDNTTLHSVALDSTFEETRSLPDGLSPTSLAFDWVGGHIFSLESPGFQIELTTINGEEAGSVLDFTGPDKLYSSLDVLGEVAFDTATNTLYWTYVSLKEGLGEELRYMNLLDQVERSIDLEGRKIRGLIAEPNNGSLFWINEAGTNQMERSIERYDIQKGQFEVLRTTSADVQALASLVLEETTYLLWIESGSIYLHDGTASMVYRTWSPGGGRVVGMVGGHTTQKAPTYCRSQSQRPCSHYCVTTEADTTQRCLCPANSKLSGTQCESPKCGSLMSCGGAYGECFPRTYWCDHITHCRNGADEECECSLNDFGCYQSEPGRCVSWSAKCNGTSECPNGEDERDCCVGEFGCYVTVETGDLLGGGPDMSYTCLNNKSVCDNTEDCFDASDEHDDCPTFPPSTDLSGVPATISVPIAIVCTILAIVVTIIVLSVCCYLMRAFRKKKQQELASDRMVRAFNLNLTSYKRDSPQLRVDSVSDYYSEFSGGTHTTQFSGGTHTTQIGNGSHISGSGNSMYKRQSAAGLSTDPSNPPPSPMTLRRSFTALTDIEDDESVFSETISEFPVPPGPTPSLNYDVDFGSDNLSFSVSQSQFPATINGRAPNPLLVHQQQRSMYPYPPYHHNGGYPHPTALQGGHGHHWGGPKRVQDPTNGKNPYQNNCHHYPPSHPRKELDSIARTETESTISMTTVSTENRDDYFEEEAMSYAPPGRPPSPVTVVSEYPAPPISPDSTISGFSEDECSERHLHQT